VSGECCAGVIYLLADCHVRNVAQCRERLLTLRKVSRSGTRFNQPESSLALGDGDSGGWRCGVQRARIGCMPSTKSGTGSGGSDVGLLREYVTHLRVEKGLRPLSVEAYHRDLESFAEFVECVPQTLVSARQEDVSGFMRHLREHGVESRSVARKLSCLRGFYRWLLKDKRINHDPTVNIESPSSWKVLPKSLAEGDVREMLERTGAAARSDAADGVALRDHAMMELL